MNHFIEALLPGVRLVSIALCAYYAFITIKTLKKEEIQKWASNFWFVCSFSNLLVLSNLILAPGNRLINEISMLVAWLNIVLMGLACYC